MLFARLACPQAADAEYIHKLYLPPGLWCVLGLSIADDGRWPVLDRCGRSGKVGAAVNTTLDQNGRDAGPAWGFFEGTATTPRWHGLGAGATGRGVVDLWSERPGDFEWDFSPMVRLRSVQTAP